MEKLGINIGFVLMQIALFTILLLVLRGYLYNPILNALEERKQRIAKGIEDAHQASIARDNAEAEAKKIIEGARSEAVKVRSDAVSAAEGQASDIKSRAQEDAREIVANAREEAQEERNRILADMRNQIAAISIAAANKLVGESLDETRQRALVKDFFAKVPDSVKAMSGDSAVVTSALPLDDSEKEAARRAIGAASIEFKVDPSILGGLVVRVGDQVVDDSVAGKMGSMREALK